MRDHNLGVALTLAEGRMTVATAGDKPRKIRDDSFRVLAALLEQYATPVAREDLFARVWPDRAFDRKMLAPAIFWARRALVLSPLDIEYVCGQGYRMARLRPGFSDQIEPAEGGAGAMAGRG